MQKIFSLLAIVLIIGALSACDMSTPSQVNASKISVKENFVTKTFDVHRFDEAEANRLAQDIVQNGNSAMNLTISYLPDEYDANIEIAREDLAIFRGKFALRGVQNIEVVTVPVNRKSDAGKLIVSYKSLVASAPKECSSIIGLVGGENMDGMNGYEFGCSMKSAISKMVADPADLLGRSSSSPVESRRQGAVVENYKSGVPNEPLKGFNASDIGVRN